MLEGQVKGQRNRGRPHIYLEKDVTYWMEANVWRVRQTAEDRLMTERSFKERSETDKRHNISKYSAVLWNEKSLQRQFRFDCTVHNGFLISNHLSLQQTPYFYIYRYNGHPISGFAKTNNPSLLCKWVGGSRSHSDFVFGKSSQNSSKTVLIFWSRIPCVFCLYMHC